MTNRDDQIRDSIMRFLLSIHKNPSSIDKVGVGIQDLQKEMKKLGYKRNEVNSNVDYLIQKGWIVIHLVEQVYRGGNAYPPKKKYKISAEGIDKFEGASMYQKKITGIQFNIEGSDNLTIIGDGNIVNTGYAELSRTLDSLAEAVSVDADISVDEKVAAIADINSIQSQLQKPKPNKGVIRNLWDGLQNVTKIAGIIGSFEKIHELMAPLLT